MSEYKCTYCHTTFGVYQHDSALVCSKCMKPDETISRGELTKLRTQIATVEAEARAEKYRKQRNALDRENKKLRARIRALDLDHEWVESDDSDLPDPFV